MLAKIYNLHRNILNKHIYTKIGGNSQSIRINNIDDDGDQQINQEVALDVEQNYDENQISNTMPTLEMDNDEYDDNNQIRNTMSILEMYNNNNDNNKTINELNDELLQLHKQIDKQKGKQDKRWKETKKQISYLHNKAMDLHAQVDNLQKLQNIQWTKSSTEINYLFQLYKAKYDIYISKKSDDEKTSLKNKIITKTSNMISSIKQKKKEIHNMLNDDNLPTTSGTKTLKKRKKRGIGPPPLPPLPPLSPLSPLPPETDTSTDTSTNTATDTSKNKQIVAIPRTFGRQRRERNLGRRNRRISTTTCTDTSTNTNTITSTNTNTKTSTETSNNTSTKPRRKLRPVFYKQSKFTPTFIESDEFKEPSSFFDHSFKRAGVDDYCFIRTTRYIYYILISETKTKIYFTHTKITKVWNIMNKILKHQEIINIFMFYLNMNMVYYLNQLVNIHNVMLILNLIKHQKLQHYQMQIMKYYG